MLISSTQKVLSSLKRPNNGEARLIFPNSKTFLTDIWSINRPRLRTARLIVSARQFSRYAEKKGGCRQEFSLLPPLPVAVRHYLPWPLPWSMPGIITNAESLLEYLTPVSSSKPPLSTKRFSAKKTYWNITASLTRTAKPLKTAWPLRTGTCLLWLQPTSSCLNPSLPVGPQLAVSSITS